GLRARRPIYAPRDEPDRFIEQNRSLSRGTNGAVTRPLSPGTSPGMSPDREDLVDIYPQTPTGDARDEVRAVSGTTVGGNGADPIATRHAELERQANEIVGRTPGLWGSVLVLMRDQL